MVKTDLLSKFSYLVINPKKFFKSIKDEETPSFIKNFIVLFAITTIFSLLGGVLYSFIEKGKFYFTDAGIIHHITLLFFTFNTVEIALFSPFILFIYPLFIHIFIKMFGGIGKIKDTYKICLYSIIPILIIRSIPFIQEFYLINWIVFAYYLFLLTIGINVIHEISKTRSFVSSIVPSIIFFFLAFILILYLFLSAW